jgi:hypothetical protein
MKNFMQDGVFLYPLIGCNSTAISGDSSSANICWSVDNMCDGVISTSKDFIVDSGDIVRYSSSVNEGLLLLFMHASFIYYSSNPNTVDSVSFISVTQDFSMFTSHNGEVITDKLSPLSYNSHISSRQNKNESPFKPALDYWSYKFSSIFSYVNESVTPREDQKSHWQLLR